MRSLRTTISALVLSSLASVALAQPAPDDHNVHHPADTLTTSEAPAATSSPPADITPLLERMNTQMANMQQLHQKFQSANAEERQTLVAEHHKMMQEGMKLMTDASGQTQNMMGQGMMGGMMGQGMMGSMNNAGTNAQAGAPGMQMMSGMMQHHELMTKRMDMMQSMMQMMMDRMDAVKDKE